MGETPDLLDWTAAALFALASIVLGLWAILMMVSLVELPLGVATLVVAVLSWFAARGVFSRDREAWWVGLLVTVMGLVFWVPEVLRYAMSGRVPPGPGLAFTTLVAFLLVYLVLRRDRYGVGRRLPASMTLGCPAEKAK